MKIHPAEGDFEMCNDLESLIQLLKKIQSIYQTRHLSAFGHWCQAATVSKRSSNFTNLLNARYTQLTLVYYLDCNLITS